MKQIGIAVIIVSLLVLAAGLMIYLNSASQTEWKETHAVVLESDIVVVRSKTEGQTAAISYFEPKVHYSYTIDGVSYESDFYSSSPPSERRGASPDPSQSMRDLIARYPVGGTISVFVNPNDPTRAAIQIPEHPVRWLAILGFIGLLVGLALRRTV